MKEVLKRFLSARSQGASGCLMALTLVTVPQQAVAAALMDIFERARTQDMSLQAALHARDAAMQALPQARAALLPQINGAYAYQEQFETGTEGFGGGPELSVDRDSNARQFSLTLDQTLFDWSAFRQYAQAGDQVALAQVRFRGAHQDLIVRAAARYFDVLAASDSLRFAQSEKKAVSRQLELARQRFEVGMSAITDVQEALARRDLTVAQEITSRQLLANNREALREMVGAGDTPIAALQEELPLTLPTPATVEPWVSTSIENNVSLLAARLAREASRKGIEVAKAGHFPTVVARAQYTDSDASGSRFTGNNETETYSVLVQIPVFSGFATRSTVKQAEALLRQSDAEMRGTRRSVERQTRDAFLAVEVGVARVKALQQAVISSQTALEASEVGLEVGTRTAVDVLNAQTILYSAQRDLSRARYDYLLSVLALKAAAGTLGSSDLQEIDALLVREPRS